jgi:hypothetical protein
MKTGNLKNLLMISAITVSSLVGLTVVAQDGISTGNGTDNVLPYRGFKEKVKLNSARVTPQLERNFNKIDSQSEVKQTARLKKVSVGKISPSGILKLYTFPDDDSIMEGLYEKAVKKSGDFSTLENPNNPFASFLKDRSGKKTDAMAVFNKIDEYVYPIESLSEVAEGLIMKADVTVNKQMSEKGCAICNWTDYKPIPAGGIALETTCEIRYIRDAQSYQSVYPENAIFYTGVKTQITSQMDIFKINTAVMTRDMAEYIRVKYCNDPTISEIIVTINCYLKPVTEDDSNKLQAAFDQSYVSLGEAEVKLANFAVENKKNISVQEYKMTSPFLPNSKYYLGNTMTIGSGTYLKLLPSIQDIVSYEFKSSYSSDPMVFIRSEADLAELVRKAYVAAYELTRASSERD